MTHNMAPADWSNMPEVILSRIFGMCDLSTRLNVPDVCRSWRFACNRGESWRSFIYCEFDLVKVENLTQIEYNEHLDAINKRVIDAITLFGKSFRSVTLHLTGSESFSLLEPLATTCRHLQHLSVLGRRGLAASKSPNDKWLTPLLLRNTKLRRVCIENFDFMTQQTENNNIPLWKKHTGLRNVNIVNSFLNNSLRNLKYLVNLEKLWVSPQQLDYSMIKKLLSLSLRKLHIVINHRCSQLYMFININSDQWQNIHQMAPHLKVQCRLSGNQQWPEEAVLLSVAVPLTSLLHAKWACLDYTSLVPLVLNYSSTLQEFIDCDSANSPVPGLSVAYQERVDKHVLEICRNCASLHTLCLKTVVSSSILLLIARISKSLKNLYIREDTIHYCWDLPVDELDLEQEDIEFAEQHWSQQKFCEGISNVLKCNWEPLTRDSYNNLVRLKYV